MDKIKILMVLGNTGMGGSQAFVLNLIQNIDLNRFHFDIIVNNEKPDGISEKVRQLGCEIFILPYFRVYNYFQYVKTWRLFLKEHHYDIVHAHSTNSASVFLKIAKEYGIITIAHSHSAGYRGNKIQQLAKKFFAKGTSKMADYWFACSDKAAFRLYGEKYKHYPFYYDIPNAISAEKYKYKAEVSTHIRKKYGIGDDVFLCGHVGTFSQPKNHLFLLDIFIEVIKRNPNARLMCCGTGALMPQIKEKAETLGILEKVIFTGVVMNVNEFMMAMDVFIFPSIFEGFPISVIEAEATGLPVVMSDIITKEVDVTDLVHRQSLDNSAACWAEICCNMKHVNRSLYNQVIVDSKYNIKNSVKMLSSLYLQMLDKK